MSSGALFQELSLKWIEWSGMRDSSIPFGQYLIDSGKFGAVLPAGDTEVVADTDPHTIFNTLLRRIVGLGNK